MHSVVLVLVLVVLAPRNTSPFGLARRLCDCGSKWTGEWRPVKSFTHKTLAINSNGIIKTEVKNRGMQPET